MISENMQNKLVFRLLGLFSYIIIAVFAVYFLRPNYLVSILAVLGPPSLINFIWLKNSRLKILLFSLAATLFFAPPIELMTRLVDAWDVASVLPRPLGLIPLENMLFAFFNFFWVLSFYEYFIDHDIKARISSRAKYIMGMFLIFFVLVFTLFFANSPLIRLHYYMMAAILLTVPTIIIFTKYPQLLKKTIAPTIFFALVFFIYEIVSMSIGHWWWPGVYLYVVKINGMTFPLDDVIIWYLLSTPALIAGYEFFIDDRK